MTSHAWNFAMPVHWMTLVRSGFGTRTTEALVRLLDAPTIYAQLPPAASDARRLQQMLSTTASLITRRPQQPRLQHSPWTTWPMIPHHHPNKGRSNFAECAHWDTCSIPHLDTSNVLLIHISRAKRQHVHGNICATWLLVPSPPLDIHIEPWWALSPTASLPTDAVPRVCATGCQMQVAWISLPLFFSLFLFFLILTQGRDNRRTQSPAEATDGTDKPDGEGQKAKILQRLGKVLRRVCVWCFTLENAAVHNGCFSGGSRCFQ